jgi:transposase
MLPENWGRHTYGENMDWLDAATERELASYERVKIEAWHYGVAFNAAYAAAWSNQNPYPKSAAEMFSLTGGEEILSDLSEEEIRKRQERMWDLEMNRMAAGLEIAAARQQAAQV